MTKKANELLFEAVRNDDLDSVKKALERNIKINMASQWEGTALHIAASKGHLSIISFLLDNGADSTQWKSRRFLCC